MFQTPLNSRRPTRQKAALANALNMIEGHHRFLQRNTGDTTDATLQHFVQNTQGVLANNRHFIAHSQMEYQPNGDGTTEGQSLHILGYAHAYLATRDPRYLEAAVWYWEAYEAFFYAGQPIPDTPQRRIANWIVNAKEPVLANWPINVAEPTHSGFKGVEFTFSNGALAIPHGAPHWGEYLDKATFAFDGALALDVAYTGGVSFFDVTLDQPSCALTFLNMAVPAGYTWSFTVRLVQGTGANQVTFPAAIHWPAERPPLLSYESGAADLVTFTWDGAKLIGLHEGSWFNVSSPA